MLTVASPVPRQPAVPRGPLKPWPLMPLPNANGFVVQVGLPSYRSLPLCCIERIALKIDDAEVDSSKLRFRLADVSHSLDDLAELTDVWWFILDVARLEVDLAIEPGEHDVELTVVTVEPYITNGRFSFTHTDRARLGLDKETAQ